MTLNNWKILLKKILPPFIIFFIVVIAFWVFALPFMENNLINSKKETIRQLSNTVWHLMDDYHQKVKENELTEKEAKEKVKEQIKSLRYGSAGKDYFWIHDLSPRMVIHPYKPELNGKDLSNYEDPEGKKLFVKMVEVCKEKGSGFVDYHWQWKDEPERVEPKISYVKLFEPWGWIIGTGIYINDVHDKIDQITSRMNIVFAVFGLLVLVTSFLISMNSIKTEDELRESRAKFRELFNMAPDPAFMLSKEGVLIEVNEAAKEKVGYEEKELIGLSLRKPVPFMPEKSREIAVNNFEKRLRGQEVAPYSFEAVTKDNKTLIFEVNVRSIEKKNRFTGAIVIARDITERKQAEKELQVKNRISNTFINSEDEHFYKEVLDIFREFFVTDYGFFGYINEEGDLVAESMTRDVWDECQIKDKSIIFSKDTWGGLWGDALKERKTLYRNGNLQFPQGHVQLQNAIAAPIVVNNKLIGLIVLANKQGGFTKSDKQLINNLCDYTAPLLHSKFKEDKYKQDLLEAKEKAEESDRLKSAFLANMSHEIRTPMNGIMGFSQMLQEQEFPKEKRDEYLSIIHNRTNHLLNIINDLVDVSKIEANQLKLNFQHFCLNDVMKELYRVFRNQLHSGEKGHIELKVNAPLDRDNSFIYSDPSRFRQIMDNLLNNAIKFTHEGSIEFGYELPSEDQLLFYVKDTGIGISSDQQINIFERFRQADDTTKRIYEGTGLGLTISKNLAELMGGQMWIDSAEGEGSVFYFTLPYETQKSTGKDEIKEEVNDETEGESQTLLVIEDDSTSLEYLKELLKPSGFKVLTCETGEEGYEAFLNNPEIVLILMDIKLPDTTGLELTRKIRSSAHNSDVPIIAQTAYALGGDAKKSIEAGCDDYISKPIDKKKLLAKISKFI